MEKLICKLEDMFKKLSTEFKNNGGTTEQFVHSVHLALSGLVTPSIKRQSVKPVRGYMDGCFDIMHSGHYNAIRQAKALCDVLVVGVHSDKEILHHKGPPVMNNDERMGLVKACKWVDEVVFDTPYNPSIELLDKLNCDFSIHGDDMPSTSDGKDAYYDVRTAGRLRIIKRTEGVSTTDLVGRLLLMTKTHHLPSDAPTARGSQPGSPVISASPGRRLSLDGTDDLPSLSLGTGIATAAVGVTAAPDAPTPPAAAAAPAAADVHYSKGVSTFLPTTWRLSQFTNRRLPKQGDTVVYVAGSFDLFHIGHINMLEKCAALGDFLFVGLHNDETVNKYRGKNYPIMNLHERVLNVLSCKFVDEVVIGAPLEITQDLVTTLKIDLVCTGVDSGPSSQSAADSDSTDEDPLAYPRSAGILREIPLGDAISTSDVIQRIVDNRLKYEKRNATRSKKDLAYLKNKSYVQEV